MSAIWDHRYCIMIAEFVLRGVGRVPVAPRLAHEGNRSARSC